MKQRKLNMKALIRGHCQEVARILISKNKKYGNSALEPVHIFSKVGTFEQLNVRIDDKLSRISQGQKDDEDVELDLIGYLVLRCIARKVGKIK